MGPSSNQDQTISNNRKLPQNEQNIRSGPEVIPVSKSRQAAPQVLAVGAKNLLLLSYGCTIGFSTILLPALQKAEPEIDVTLDEITWISSLNLILVPVGCLGSGLISGYLGRRKTMMILNAPFIAAWIMYYYSYNSSMLFCALAMTGLTGGLLEAPVLTYVAEVTQPHLRGMLSATSTMSVILGIFIQMLAGSLTTWRVVALVNMIFPILCFVLLCLIPESPHWLIEKGRMKEALKALRWLRGWVPADHVREEYNTVCESIQKPQQLEAAGEERAWRHYTNRTFWVPFFLVSWAFIVGHFGGMTPLQTFAVSVFGELHAPIEQFKATVFMGAAELLGTLSCVILIHFTGKRIIALSSILSTAVCFSIAALYGNLIQRGLVIGEDYSWIPTYALIGAAYLSHFGIRLLPWILIGEVFSSQVRSVAAGAVSAFGYACGFVVNKVYLYMKNGMTLAGTFWFYSAVGFVGAIVIYFILPETEGRTLREIQEHYAGTHDLKTRPRKEDLPIKEKWTVSNPIPVVDDVESKL
ncbi:facilitated trehalose transporter Tret1-like [Neodiprion fabricii]|uniref:facilitated trehalose transporter Tret1-like n=1 Tax=Neodiprion fabricii TaxID=2872261 RepID=UPI001ED969B7|nr:facilitated trehalose transporter Tret1-like [Neodiprion fabricii]